jgi:CheY-like chemotaxis protein
MNERAAGASILVVDDAAANVKLLRLILSDAGYRVLEAGSGPQALEILHRDRPDAMVLDVRMPGMTGYEVCQAVRRDPEFATLPVIMVTALSMAEERIRGIEAGATDFITKPFNKKELLARLRASLEMAGTGNGALLAQLPGAVVLTDTQWNIRGLTPAAAALLGLGDVPVGVHDFAALLDGAALAAAGAGAEFGFEVAGRSLRGLAVTVNEPGGAPLLHVIALSVS